MRVSLLVLLATLTSGCVASAHTGSPAVSAAIVAPAPHVSVGVTVPVTPTIQFHYVWTNSVWVRRPGPPPRGVTYYRHPRHSHTVIVHRSTASRPVHRHAPPRHRTHRRSTR